MPNGTKQSYRYDEADHLLGIDYSHDANGNIRPIPSGLAARSSRLMAA